MKKRSPEDEPVIVTSIRIRQSTHAKLVAFCMANGLTIARFIDDAVLERMGDDTPVSNRSLQELVNRLDRILPMEPVSVGYDLPKGGRNGTTKF